MKNVRCIVFVLVAACSIIFPRSWSQEANPPAGTKQGSKSPEKGTTATDQSGKTTIKAERVALQREAEAIEARHMALDAEIASWSDNLGRWIREHEISNDPAQVVLSLSSRSYFLHQSKHSDGAGGDSGYSQLEDQMKDIQTKRKHIEADWVELLSRDRASIAMNHVKTAEKVQSFDFDFGDSTIPIPGISARQRCCPLTPRDSPAANCKLVGEWCSQGTGKRWVLNCLYICDVVALP
jgi:hypothetical protein